MLLDENSFYNKFKRQVTEFNLQVETAKTGYMNFLNKLSENIQTKKTMCSRMWTPLIIILLKA